MILNAGQPYQLKLLVDQIDRDEVSTEAYGGSEYSKKGQEEVMMRVYYSKPLLEELREPRARLDQHGVDHILPLRGHTFNEANLLIIIIFLRGKHVLLLAGHGTGLIIVQEEIYLNQFIIM